jgi:hypothetical protein
MPDKRNSSPNIIRQIKSRRMRWAAHVARMEEERNVYKLLMGAWIRVDLGEIGWGVDSVGSG